MEKIKNLIKDNYIIIIILLLAFGVRWYGIYFDYPQGVTYIWDESYHITKLIDIAESKNIFAGHSAYPFLLSFVYLPVFILRLGYLALTHGITSIEGLKQLLVEGGMGQLFIIARWYSVLFGTATVFLIYKIYSQVFKSRYSALYASSAFALSLMPVFLNHWGRRHGEMEFFIVATLLLVLMFEKTKAWKYFYGSIATAALATSTHYIGVGATIYPFFAFIFNRQLFDYKKIVKSSIIFLTIVIALYLPNYRDIISMFKSQYYDFYIKTDFTGALPVSWNERFFFVIRDIFYIEPVFLVLFVVMAIAGFKKYFKASLARYVFIGIIFNYFYNTFVVTGPHLTRWLMTLITLIAPMGAGMLIEYLTEREVKKKLILVIALILLMPNAYFVYRWDAMLRQDTRKEAVVWMEQNMKRNEYLYEFNNWFDPPLSYDAALWNKENNNRSSRKLDFIISNKDKYENIGINVMYDYEAGRYCDLAGPKTKYVMLDYWTIYSKDIPPNVSASWSKEDADARKINIEKCHKLKMVATFYPTKDDQGLKKGFFDYLNNPLYFWELSRIDKSGPFIEIYEVLK